MKRLSSQTAETGSHVPTEPAEPWTDEKHLCFLNSMEASFVHTILSKLRRFACLRRSQTPDLRSHRPQNHSSSEVIAVELTGRRTIVNGRHQSRTRRSLSSLPYNSSQDQVVPQMEEE